MHHRWANQTPLTQVFFQTQLLKNELHHTLWSSSTIPLCILWFDIQVEVNFTVHKPNTYQHNLSLQFLGNVLTLTRGYTNLWKKLFVKYLARPNSHFSSQMMSASTNTISMFLSTFVLIASNFIIQLRALNQQDQLPPSTLKIVLHQALQGFILCPNTIALIMEVQKILRETWGSKHCTFKTNTDERQCSHIAFQQM